MFIFIFIITLLFDHTTTAYLHVHIYAQKETMCKVESMIICKNTPNSPEGGGGNIPKLHDKILYYMDMPGVHIYSKDYCESKNH